MLDLTALGGGTVLTLVTLVAIGSPLALRNRAEALFISVAVGGGGLLGAILKIVYARPRPELVAHLVEVSPPSFPSGHAMNSAVTYLTLGVLTARAAPDRRLKVYVLWVGVHWPTDVLAGSAVGLAWAGLCWVVAERLRVKRGSRIEKS